MSDKGEAMLLEDLKLSPPHLRVHILRSLRLGTFPIMTVAELTDGTLRKCGRSTTARETVHD